MGAGAAYKDIEFLERALEFSNDFTRSWIANLIRKVRTEIEAPMKFAEDKIKFPNRYTIFARKALLDPIK